MSRRAPRAGGRTATAFGRWLKKQRLAFGKRNSYEEIERQLRGAGGHFVTGSTLQRYETEGRIPDVLTIFVLAQLYDFDFLEAVQMLQRELTATTKVEDQKVDSGVESATPLSESPDHGTDAAALSAEIKQLRYDVAGNADLLKEITESLEAIATRKTTQRRVSGPGTGKSQGG